MGTLVGKKAPEFTAGAIVNGKIVDKFSLTDYVGKHNVIFFFYPLDFTFVCPTELHAFQDKLTDFEERNTKVVGCSVDSCYSHLAWLNTPKGKGGIEGVSYPIVSDINKTIAKDYDVLVHDQGITYRGLFLIDQMGTVRHQVINDLPLGRSIDEALRILDALIFFEKNGEVCPAGWNKGSKGMNPTQVGLENYFSTP